MHILSSCHVSKVVGSAVCLFGCFNILLGSLSDTAIIALAGCGLERKISRQTVLLVRSEVVVGESATLNVVLHLLGDISHMGYLVEFVATTAEFVNAVILKAQLGIRTEA